MRTVLEEGLGTFMRLSLERDPNYPNSWPDIPSIDRSSSYDSRARLEELLHDDQVYHFVRVHGNPLVLEAVNKELQRKVRKGDELPEQLRALTGAQVEAYLAWVDSELKRSTKFLHYPLVIGGVSRHGESFVWPHVYVFRREEDLPALTRLVESVTSDSAMQFLRNKESPQNYHVPLYELIQKLGLPVLLVHPRRATLTGRQLRDALDFTSQFEFNEYQHDCTRVVDAD